MQPPRIPSLPLPPAAEPDGSFAGASRCGREGAGERKAGRGCSPIVPGQRGGRSASAEFEPR